MTTTTIWTCDNHHCGKKVEGREPKWLTLGSEDGNSLRIRNPIGKHGLRETNSHGDMHFCSSTCLIKAFFGQHVAALEREILVKHERLFFQVANHLEANNEELKQSHMVPGRGWDNDIETTKVREIYEEVERLVAGLRKLVPPSEGWIEQ